MTGQDVAKPTGPQRQWIKDCAAAAPVRIHDAGSGLAHINADLLECVRRGWIRLTRIYEVTEKGRKYV